MTKTPLKKCAIALTGDFGKARPHVKIRHWTEFQGGTVVTKVDVNVTHLVCSQEHYKKNVAMVKQAKKIKTCSIVSFDWLEDSLMKFTAKRVKPYLLKVVTKERARAKVESKQLRDEDIKTGVIAFEKLCDDFKNVMLTDGYHIYRDPTSGLSYEIVLARVDLTNNTNERYALKIPHHIFPPLYPYHPPSPRRLRVPLPRPRTQCVQLYQTHGPPHMFACFVQYSSPTRGIAKQVLAPLGSSFALAIGSWEQFFRIKCKREWKERNGVVEAEEEPGDEGVGGKWVYKASDEDREEVRESVEW